MTFMVSVITFLTLPSASFCVAIDAVCISCVKTQHLLQICVLESIDFVL
jgi:hypothetical protein